MKKGKGEEPFSKQLMRRSTKTEFRSGLAIVEASQAEVCACERARVTELSCGSSYVRIYMAGEEKPLKKLGVGKSSSAWLLLLGRSFLRNEEFASRRNDGLS